MSAYKNQIDSTRLPKHIAIIMDGNGRWAKQKMGRTRIFGHVNGVKAVRTATEACANLGISYLTLYTFSTENWARPPIEVQALMRLLVRTIRQEIKQLNDNNIRLQAIGKLETLPKECYDELKTAIKLTENNTGLTLTLALSYSSRWELTEAMRLMAQAVKQGKLHPENIDEQTVTQYLATKNMPDPELLIRTSGEQRISNYLLWQIAYTELYFTQTLWPDFDETALYQAIIAYQKRDRRFGKVK